MKFLLIDDHPLMRSALKAVVQTLGSEVLAIEAGTPGDARDALARNEDLDAVLLDLKLGVSDGFGVLRDIRAQRPRLPVMVVTGSDDGRDLIRAIDGGAMAYVHKRSSQAEILQALNTVMSGGIHLPDDMMQLLHSARAEAAAEAARPAPVSVDFGGGMPAFNVQVPSPQIIARLGLTPRQTDVLMLLLHGKPNKLIARELNLSVETIKDHVAAVLRSLNVTSRTQAVLAVTQLSHGGARRGLQ
ncbi:MAG: response regulator transcription factor [Rubrivivax sp.]|nr:response regulator transcription factor [Rubrivivax sp.]